MKRKDFIYHEVNEITFPATVYYSDNPVKNQTVLYFHGGGLIYGTRLDLPNNYIESFLNAGYHFISFDYPLAPESGFEFIYSTVKQAVKWFIREAVTLETIGSSDYILFGRSAGAYLCFLLACDSSLPEPHSIINFYGYDSLTYTSFQKPSKHYLKYPTLPGLIIKRLIQPNPIASGPLETRYSLYLYARQTGKWLDFLHIKDDMSKAIALSKEELNNLPPTFIAHSKTDQDVPYSIAEHLNHLIPETYLFTVQNGEHDFDRDPDSEVSQKAYNTLLTWLET